MPDELLVADGAAWRSWLLEHHADSDGVWLVLARRNADSPTSLVYADALDEALCFGWIDSQVKGRDTVSTYQRFTPRRKQSKWSARNVEYVSRLIDEGRMHAAGQAEIDRARADGRWDVAYAGPATITVPPDLASALAESPDAQAMFDVLTSQNRYALLFRLHHLKTAAGRQKRIAATVADLARGATPYPQKRRPPGMLTGDGFGSGAGGDGPGGV